MVTDEIETYIKDRRREQNARAQQRSRARRRALRHALKEDNPGNQLQCCRESSSCAGKSACPPPELKYDDLLSCFARTSDIENVAKIFDAENLNIASIIKYGLISMGYCLDDSIFESSKSLCFACWSSAIVPLMGNRFTIDTVILAGVSVLSRHQGPARWQFQATSHCIPTMPQSKTHISSFVRIAEHIGLSFEQITADNSVSPFICTSSHLPWAEVGSTTALKPDLQPVHEQLTIFHHPYLDLIPFPSFRSRALVAIAREGPDFNEHALCFDIMHGGMQCNGSSQISLHGRGDGAPWDARSWEVAPWFFRKWGALVGDENDIIYQNSAWWWARY